MCPRSWTNYWNQSLVLIFSIIFLRVWQLPSYYHDTSVIASTYCWDSMLVTSFYGPPCIGLSIKDISNPHVWQMYNSQWVNTAFINPTGKLAVFNHNSSKVGEPWGSPPPPPLEPDNGTLTSDLWPIVYIGQTVSLIMNHIGMKALVVSLLEYDITLINPETVIWHDMQVP